MTFSLRSASLSFLVVLFVICMFARGLGDKTPMAEFISSSILISTRRLLQQARYSRALSMQDQEPIYALVHNTEAISYIKAAMQICTEYKICEISDSLDVLEDLKTEQELILLRIIQNEE